MVVTLGQGWEDGVDAILMQYYKGSILGPTTVIKSCFNRRRGDKNGPAHSDPVLPIIRAGRVGFRPFSSDPNGFRAIDFNNPPQPYNPPGRGRVSIWLPRYLIR